MKIHNQFFIIMITVIFMLGSMQTSAATPEESYDIMLKTIIEEMSSEGSLPISKFELADSEQKIKNTFEETKTISGVTEKGTSISIFVTQKNSDDSQTEATEYLVDVGISGMFTQKVNLKLGENIIVVHAKKDDKESIFLYIIKRKDSEIKQDLKPNIALPGKSIINSKINATP